MALLDRFNRMVEPLGLRVEPVGRCDRLFNRLLRRRGSFKFVQVGAHDGVLFDDLYWRVTARRLPGLVLEPLPDLFQRLMANYAEFPEVVPVRCAVHATQREAVLYRVDPARLGEFEHGTAGIPSFQAHHHQRSGIPSDAMVAERVPCLPLMAVLEQHGFLDAAYLQVDVEGCDGAVSRMIDYRRFHPALVKFESESLEPADLRDVQDRLRAEGYRLYVEGPDTLGELG